MQIIYERHPVSPERKAELRAAGYRIIDARFAPADALAVVEIAEVSAPVESAPVTAPRRGRPRKGSSE